MYLCKLPLAAKSLIFFVHTPNVNKPECDLHCFEKKREKKPSVVTLLSADQV
jgi:hypothetical protein